MRVQGWWGGGGKNKTFYQKLFLVLLFCLFLLPIHSKLSVHVPGAFSQKKLNNDQDNNIFNYHRNFTTAVPLQDSR